MEGQTGFEAFSFTNVAYTDSTLTATSTLNIDVTKLTDSDTVKCKVNFESPISDPLETQTQIQRRGYFPWVFIDVLCRSLFSLISRHEKK